MRANFARANTFVRSVTLVKDCDNSLSHTLHTEKAKEHVKSINVNSEHGT